MIVNSKRKISLTRKLKELKKKIKVAKIGKKWRIERTKQTKQHEEFPQKIHGGIMAKKVCQEVNSKSWLKNAKNKWKREKWF